MANTKLTPQQAVDKFKADNPHLTKVSLADVSKTMKMYTIEVSGKCEHFRLASELGKCYGVVTRSIGTTQQHTDILMDLE